MDWELVNNQNKKKTKNKKKHYKNMLEYEIERTIYENKKQKEVYNYRREIC
jgi:hypothetical protein